MTRNLVILGTGGHAREMAQLVEQANVIQRRWTILGFVGEPGCEVGKNLGIASILGDDDWLSAQDFQADIVIGIGYPDVRKKAVQRYLINERFSFPNVIHPSAVIDEKRMIMGMGNTVSPGCVFTCDITVGDFNHFNYNSTIGHDTKIGSFNVINPGVNISGYAQLADAILVGTGAQILQSMQIDSLAVIGAGAVVTHNVRSGSTVVGVPARPMKNIRE